jgi:Purple acid Phosphatase, N-terminal domain/Calcineurin-like phosphoesterase
MATSEDSVSEDGNGVSRRNVLRGAAGIGAVIGAGGLIDVGFEQRALAAPDPGNTTVPLPTTTAPEQLHLTWGADPKTQVTASWAAPGTVAQPAPSLTFSDRPLGRENPGQVIRLPKPEPLSMKEVRFGPQTISYTDGLSGETTYHYHVPLENLRPDTTYYYEVTDGAKTPSTASGYFTTAPAGRAKFRFSSYGDIGTPTSASKFNVTGFSWNSEASNDTCVFEVDATITASDGGPAPLFHLINGDLCYADNDPANTPSVWRDFSVNVSRSAAFRPWMPTLGNHESELGVDAQDGLPSSSAFWNGAYGNGNYQARFLLPYNGVTNYDGNRLQGQFYSFQVGTVLFIALDADDITLQNVQASTSSQITYASGVTVPGNVVNSGYEYSGELDFTEKDFSIVPAGPKPNKETLWLERALEAARRNPAIDMIVAWMHQTPVSTSTEGNGSDMGIRATWGPLFDKYEVDLVLHGHEHDYERTYPVRGFDAAAGTVTTAFTSSLNGTEYAVGDTIDTRRPHVVTTTPGTVDGAPAYDTANGTVYLVLGGGGASATNTYGEDAATGLPQANVWVTLDGRNAVEDATWSAARDTTDAHGYAYFDVDPGEGPGDTTITFQWFQVPTVPSGGSITLPATPYEKFVFGRNLNRRGGF